MAARTVADRIATQLGTTTGNIVGYAVRFSEKLSQETLIKVVTDGLLLSEIRTDRCLKAYDAIVVDEAHERSLNIDFLLGYFRNLLRLRPELRIIITSATIDVEAFSQHFDGAPIVKVEGRSYPVEIRYRPVDGDVESTVENCVKEILNEKSQTVRNVLMFLSGERAIMDWSLWFRKKYREYFEILPLYARLPTKEQHKIFQRGTKRKILLATNIAETSITIPGIGYVIDLGQARISRYGSRSKIQRLPIEPISQASADQRAGRCGRLAAGICFRLYSESDYETRPRYTEPEIRRSSLASVMLQMEVMKLGDIRKYPFIDPPEEKTINDSSRLLHELGALVGGELTPIGRKMADLPTDPRLARMLIEANRLNSLKETLIVVSALAVQDPRVRPLNKRDAVCESHRQFARATSDFLVFIQLWNWLENQRQQLISREFHGVLEQNFISSHRYFEWRALHRQLSLACVRLKMEPNRNEAKSVAIHKAILAGSLSFVGCKAEHGEYKGQRQFRFRIFPNSALAKRQPKWIVAADIKETGRVYAQHVAAVRARWIEKAANDQLKHFFHDKYWDERRYQAMILQTSTLYGLTVVERRPVPLSKVRPDEAREMFLLYGLVRFQGDADYSFLKHNRLMVQHVSALQDKNRRTDLLISESSQQDFYASRVPEKVIDWVSFNEWYERISECKRELLYMEEMDLLARFDVHVSEQDFPSKISIDGRSFQVKYAFAPTAANDGVSIQVPLGFLHVLSEGPLHWLVPGFLAQKCEALIRSLPKKSRCYLVPVPDLVRQLLPILKDQEHYRRQPLASSLSRVILQLKNLRVNPEDFDESSLPAFLRMNIQVLSGKGKVVDQDRDLAALKRRCVSRVDIILKPSVRNRFERTGLLEFPEHGLPSVYESDACGSEFVAYPTLIDKGECVDLMLERELKTQRRQNVWGVCRLILLTEKQSARYLIKAIKSERQMHLHYAPIGILEELLDSILLGSVRHGYLRNNPLPQTRTDFDDLVSRHKGVLMKSGLLIIEAASELLRTRFRTALAISSLSCRANAKTKEDAEQHLLSLVPADFAQRVPLDRYEDVKRYLKALQYRVEHLRGRLKYDLEKIPRVYCWVTRYQLLANTVIDLETLEELCCLLEEFRVSVFSQAIGTKVKVSEKRLEAVFQKYENLHGISHSTMDTPL